MFQVFCNNKPVEVGEMELGRVYDYSGNGDTIVKQVLIVRRDLGMRLGKSIAQGAHASLMAYRRTSLLKRIKWLLTGQTKIVVRADSEEQLLHLYQGAQDAGLTCVLVKDAGRTEFKEPTFTALGIGPDEPERLDPVTRKLELL